MMLYHFSAIMTGSYNNFFRIFDLNKKDVTLEASKNWIKPKAPLKPKKVTQKAPFIVFFDMI